MLLRNVVRRILKLRNWEKDRRGKLLQLHDLITIDASFSNTGAGKEIRYAAFDPQCSSSINVQCIKEYQ